MDLQEFPYIESSDLTVHLREQIIYLFFNLTRKNDETSSKELCCVFRQILQLLKHELVTNRSRGLPDIEFKYSEQLDIVYRLIAHTRDTVCGKGEHDLFYMMIYELHNTFPSLAVFLLYNYVGNSIGNSFDCSLGCWRDIKYLCDYVRSVSPKGFDDSLIHICIELTNRQLKKDIESWRFSVNAGSRNHISNIAKWIPREKKKFDWLFEKLAIHWSNNYGRWKLEWTQLSDPNYISALTKCKRQYRKVIARMNKILDTTEIKQCYQLWDDIDINKVSKYTIMKQPKLFLCYDEKEVIDVSKFFTLVSKKVCSKKYIERPIGINTSTDCRNIIQLPISYFVKEAFQILRTNNNNLSHRDILNSNWEKFSRSMSRYSFGNTLPIVDISYKMIENDADAFYTGVGMSILISQNSSFGKRILAIENKPVWINLEDSSSNFLSIIEKFSELIRSYNNTAFSFERGIDVIINAFHETGYVCKNMKLVLFSNGLSGNIDTYYNYLESQFNIINYHVPRLIFWNLSKNDICEIPGEKVLANCVMLSGLSSSLLKYVATLKKEDSAYDVVCRVLLGDRYDIFSQYLAGNLRISF